jgi:hypothetical protein
MSFSAHNVVVGTEQERQDFVRGVNAHVAAIHSLTVRALPLQILAPCSLSTKRFVDNDYRQRPYLGEEKVVLVSCDREWHSNIILLNFHIPDASSIRSDWTLLRIELGRALANVDGLREQLLEIGERGAQVELQEAYHEAVEIEDEAHRQAVLATRAGQNALFGSW